MDWTLFPIFLAACGAAAATGAMFQPGAWYDDLSKPGWTPPNWVFPVVWTYIYVALAVAASRVAGLEGSQYAMAFWAMQIAFNTLWTPVFFGLRRMRAALVVIAGLWVAVAGLLWSLWSLDAVSFWIVAPYILWTTVAGALNASVARRNPTYA
ncbi:TspO/MBR family protein [uncultured Jannaschia sp.]|uniref:tryptophan-rich sensory protein TspO n=1 Tax=uncultured Jannaschia sp. TaxID=293347 RepID=UPI0026173D69|nr:TspO/MBR family protein [uncultured Jannaschia sp.]